jgi:hypothetical protein
VVYTKSVCVSVILYNFCSKHFSPQQIAKDALRGAYRCLPAAGVHKSLAPDRRSD